MIQYNKRNNTYCWSKSDHIFDTRLDLRNREGKLHPDFRYLCVRRPDKPKERLELHNLSLAKFSCNACLLISIVKSLYARVVVIKIPYSSYSSASYEYICWIVSKSYNLTFWYRAVLWSCANMIIMHHVFWKPCWWLWWDRRGRPACTCLEISTKVELYPKKTNCSSRLRRCRTTHHTSLLVCSRGTIVSILMEWM